MMPFLKVRKCSKIILLLKDAWTDLTALYNSVAKQEEQNDPQRKEWIHSVRKMRKAYRKGELVIYDADPEKLFAEAIKNNLKIVTSELKERMEPKLR